MNGHAVIISGEIGGLLAAHALAGRFERVTILERERYLLMQARPRPRAPGWAPQPLSSPADRREYD